MAVDTHGNRSGGETSISSPEVTKATAEALLAANVVHGAQRQYIEQAVATHEQHWTAVQRHAIAIAAAAHPHLTPPTSTPTPPTSTPTPPTSTPTSTVDRVELPATTPPVPGMRKDPDTGVITVTAHRRTGLALQQLIHTDELLLSHLTDVAATWAARHDIDLTMTSDTHIELRTPWSKQLQHAVKQAGGTWNGTQLMWTFPLNKAADVAALQQQFHLLADNSVTAALDNATGPLQFDGTIEGLKGVPIHELAVAKTPKKAQQFHDFGITSVWDLLHVIPIRYIDRTTSTRLHRLPVGETVSFLATITKVGAYDPAKKLTRMTVSDGTATATITFFRMPWVSKKFRTNDAKFTLDDAVRASGPTV